MGESIRRGEPHLRLGLYQRPNEALRRSTEEIGHVEGAPADLAEDYRGRGVMKWIPPREHRVEDDAQRPAVGDHARVGVAVEDLRADVGGAAVLVRQSVIAVLAEGRSLQTLQSKLGSRLIRRKR